MTSPNLLALVLIVCVLAWLLAIAGVRALWNGLAIN